MEGIASGAAKRPDYPLYTTKLEPEAAKNLVEKGGTLLVLDIPQGAAFGCDQKVFLTGPRFKGVKMLPPGPHFFSTTAASGQGDFAPTCGFFHWVRPGEVIVRRWNPSLEMLAPLVDEDEEGRYIEGVKRFDFDSGLAPYDLASYNVWHCLTLHVSDKTLARLRPLGRSGMICPTFEDEGSWKPTTEAERKMAAALESQRSRYRAMAAGGATGNAGAEEPLETEAAASSGQASQASQAMEVEEGSQAGPGPGSAGAAAGLMGSGRCRYLKIARHVTGAGLSGASLTVHNLDKSSSLASLVSDRLGGEGGELVGEAEAAFVAFLVGHSLEGFNQWRDIVRLMLSCTEAPLGPLQDLFADFLEMMRAQLAYSLPEDSARDVAPGSAAHVVLEGALQGSFLKSLLASFFEGLVESGVGVGGRTGPPLTRLGRAAERLSQLVSRRLGWDLTAVPGAPGFLPFFGSDDEEGGPSIVELPEGYELPE